MVKGGLPSWARVVDAIAKLAPTNPTAITPERTRQILMDSFFRANAIIQSIVNRYF
jgi:hypothetical protein